MRLTACELPGVWCVEPQRHQDERGHFARLWDVETFAAHGLPTAWALTSTSFNPRRGTLRGLHHQRGPHAEDKLVRCTRGRIFDVAVDLRPDSPTRGRWHGVVLDPDNGRQLFIPKGCAHGFITLEDDSEVGYMISAAYAPEAAAGARWDDPAFGIVWPIAPTVIGERDRAYPDHTW